MKKAAAAAFFYAIVDQERTAHTTTFRQIALLGISFRTHYSM
jgi:hypothetical protein